MKTTKNKIKNVVKLYQDMFNDEYRQFEKEVDIRRRLVRDEFASIKDTRYIERALFEIPEKLHVALINNLTEAELKYWKSKECSRWFAKTFPVFSLVKKI